MATIKSGLEGRIQRTSASLDSVNETITKLHQKAKGEKDRQTLKAIEQFLTSLNNSKSRLESKLGNLNRQLELLQSL